MCGLVGAYSPSPLSIIEMDKLARLISLSAHRGAHSTGYFAVKEVKDKSKAPKLTWWKGLMHPADFAFGDWDAFRKSIFPQGNPNTMAFHTRQATKGKINRDNAHPFNFPSVIGMHNGTFNSGLKHEKDYDTDSEALYKEIDDIGIEKFIKEGGASGAMALVFYDKKKRTLNFYRNSQRPLHFMGLNRCLFWASEARDVINATDVIEPVSVLPFSESKIQIVDRTLFALPEGTLVTIDMDACDYMWSMKKIAKPVVYTTKYSQSGDWNSGMASSFRKEQIHSSAVATKRLETFLDASKTDLMIFNKFEIRVKKGSQTKYDHSNVSAVSYNSNTYSHWHNAAKAYTTIYPGSEVRYAVELNGFLSKWQFEQLACFRKANPFLFKETLQKTFMDMDNKSRLRAARLMGISKNTLQQIVRGKQQMYDYLEHPFTHENDGTLCVLSNVGKITQDKLNQYVSKELPLKTRPFEKKAFEEAVKPQTEDEQEKEEKEELDNINIIPFKTVLNDPLPPALTYQFQEDEEKKYNDGLSVNHPPHDSGVVSMFAVGINGRLVTFDRYQDILREGCCECADTVTVKEDVYWVDHDSFVCEDCQERLTRPDMKEAALDLGLLSHIPAMREQTLARNVKNKLQ